MCFESQYFLLKYIVNIFKNICEILMVFHLILSNQKIFSENTVYSPHHGSEIISLDVLIKMSD